MRGRVYIRTFGCQMNVKDSERMLGLLMEAGYAPADGPEDADVILINTCAVREKPERKVEGAVGRLRAEKSRPGVVIGVGGCVAQRMGEEILAQVPSVDLVFGTQTVHRLPGLLDRVRAGERIAAVEMLEQGDPELFKVPAARPNQAPTAFISIMQGCDNYCAFCIVPYVRGHETSRSADDIAAEAKALADSGVREVTLLGQNVNSYRDGGLGFPELLARVADTPGIARVRYTTSHPKDLSDELIAVMKGHPRVMEHIHLPVQAGSNEVLKRMNRRYTREHYLGLVDRLRAAMPEIGLTTDLIVGFPGETEEDFELTLDLLKRVRYDETFSFRYSPRPGTKAAGFEDQLPEEVKYKRLYRLQDLQARITEEKNLEEEGKVHEVLVEGPSKTDPGRATGRTRTNRIAHFPWEDLAAGDIARVRIVRALKHSLDGETLREAAPSRREEETCLWK